MRLVICIDDTDSKTSEKGTGAIADDIRNMVMERFAAPCSVITRHQLLLHPDVPYTSHNSSMCFETEVPDECYDELVAEAIRILSTESDPESDPGIAIADRDRVDTERLIAYGKECKRRLMHKSDAYAVAEQAGFHLSEHGGTGDGVIGAAAGVGLRLWGNDGTMKGRPKDLDTPGVFTAEEICASRYIDTVVTVDGDPVPMEDQVELQQKCKVNVVDGRFCILVNEKTDGVWQTPERGNLRNYSDRFIFREGCPDFKPDVEEEQVGGEASCYNCLYRRWMDKHGILCQKPQEESV